MLSSTLAWRGLQRSVDIEPLIAIPQPYNNTWAPDLTVLVRHAQTIDFTKPSALPSQMATGTNRSIHSTRAPN